VLLVAALGSCDSDPVVEPLPSLQIVPDSVTLTHIGQRFAFSVRGGGGPGADAVRWSSRDTTVFVVEADGTVTARGNGSAGLLVERGRQWSQAPVRVEQAAATLQTIGEGQEADGRGALLAVLLARRAIPAALSVLLAAPRVAHEVLVAVPRADRYHQASSGRELLQQGRRGRRTGRGDDDGVIGRFFGPTERAVADHDGHVSQSLGGNSGLSLLRQCPPPFDGHHPAGHSPQDQRAVARAGAHLEHPVVGAQLGRLGHHGHHGGLADGLALSYGQRPVVEGGRREPAGDELLARHPADGLQHGLVAHPVTARLGDEVGQLSRRASHLGLRAR